MCPSPRRTVAVTGASGYAGGVIARRLLAEAEAASRDGVVIRPGLVSRPRAGAMVATVTFRPLRATDLGTAGS